MGKVNSKQTGHLLDQEQAYLIGYGSEVTDFFSGRSATTHAAFFLPHLRSGMSLLDCGCGPGAITVDLAEIVAPAEVVGVDIENAQIELARARAARRGVSNVRFEIADIYDLPYPDSSFDAIFMHGLLENLREPIRALTIAHRLLKSEGVVGARSGDWGGFLVGPSVPILDESMTLWQELLQHNGVNPQFGRHQLGVMRQAGLERIEVSASFDCYTLTREATRNIAATMDAHFAGLCDQAVELGLADRSKLREMSAAWKAWGEDPHAFAAEAWCEAVAWKD